MSMLNAHARRYDVAVLRAAKSYESAFCFLYWCGHVYLTNRELGGRYMYKD